MSKDDDFEVGSGNVFADLELPGAEAMLAKFPFVKRARELLVGQPKFIRGECEFHGRVCLETHLLGLGGPPAFSGNNPLWGLNAPYTVYADWNIHDGKYERVWCAFPAPGGGIETIDVSEALRP